MERSIRRRDAIRGLGVAAVTALAGCTGGGDSDGSSGDDGGSGDSGGSSGDDGGSGGSGGDTETSTDDDSSSGSMGTTNSFEYTVGSNDNVSGSSLTGIRANYPDGSGAVSDAEIASVTLAGSDVSDDLDGTIERLRRHLRGESADYRAEFRMRAADGAWRWRSDEPDDMYQQEHDALFRSIRAGASNGEIPATSRPSTSRSLRGTSLVKVESLRSSQTPTDRMTTPIRLRIAGATPLPPISTRTVAITAAAVIPAQGPPNAPASSSGTLRASMMMPGAKGRAISIAIAPAPPNRRPWVREVTSGVARARCWFTSE